jgi:metal-responsive CopG/Arc/MetJ family transcriptional regulator
MGINGGRSRRGVEETGFERYNISLPLSLVARLEKFQIEQDRSNRSWCIQRALDEWLKKQGY